MQSALGSMLVHNVIMDIPKQKIFALVLFKKVFNRLNPKLLILSLFKRLNHKKILILLLFNKPNQKTTLNTSAIL